MKIKMMLCSVVLGSSSLIAVNAQALVAATPEEAVKGSFSTLLTDDENGFIDLIQMPQELSSLTIKQQGDAKHQMFAGMQRAVKQDGGLKTLDVDKAQAGKDSVHMQVHYKAVTLGGQVHEEDVPVVKVGDGWKVGQ